MIDIYGDPIPQTTPTILLTIIREISIATSIYCTSRDPQQRWHAMQQLWELQEKQLWLTHITSASTNTRLK